MAWKPWLRNRTLAINAQIRQISEMLLSASHTVVLSGAGISTQSGIPDFRSPESGLWQHADPLTVASIWGFREEPRRFYNWLRPLAQTLQTARPNPAHHALAQLEAAGLIDLVVTQNIDTLHQRAGSQAVVQVHGAAESATCCDCHQRVDAAAFWPTLIQRRGDDPLPQCPVCHGILKPDVVLFGEDLPVAALERAQQAALTCDLMLVVGTSLEVMPVADLPWLARRRGARLAVVNLGNTCVDHCAEVVIRADLTEALPAIAESCWQIQGHLPAR